MTLLGTGPSKAAAIVVERPFDTVGELGRVSRFGYRTVAILALLAKVWD